MSPPSAPGTPSVTNIGTTSATISWADASANGASSVSYQVTGVPGCSPGTGTSCATTGLAPLSSYTACVSATNSAGTGPATCSSTFSTTPADEGTTLTAGQHLTVGEALVSSPPAYDAVMQPDGNFVVYNTATNAPAWSTGTMGSGGTQLDMQTDGNLVLYTASGTAVWHSATSGTGNFLAMQPDGNLVVYSSILVPLWSRLGGDTGNQGNILPSNATMTGGETLYSPSGNYSLTMQTDGNLVEYTSSGAVWNTGTSGNAGAWLDMQGDGNLVVYSSGGTALWNSSTEGNAGAYLSVQGDGNVVVYTSGNVALWSSQGGLVAPTSGYPYAGAVCEFGNAGTPSCTNPSNSQDLYDWGYWSGSTFEPYDQWGYEYRNCTSYVAWRLASAGVSASLFRDLGNADSWIANVSGKPGVTVGTTPVVGAVAVWDSPGVGHVAWVESVSGGVTVSDYNYAETGQYDEHLIASAPTAYISFPG